MDFNNSEDDNAKCPPMQLVFCEGEPGTGKTFVVTTMRNMMRNLYQHNAADMTSAQTGNAAALIQGSTHYRALHIPVGTKIFEAPSAMGETNDTKAKASRRRLSNVVSYFMDKHSMVGRVLFAWIAHRHAELRKSIHIGNEDNVIIHSDTKQSECISAKNCSTNHQCRSN